MELSTATPTGTPSNLPTEKEYAGVKISLENCLFPLEVFEETPSQKDGLEKTAEDDLRRIGCEFIQIAGIMLKVPQVAMASAQVLFQRFFFAKSFVKHKMEEIAMACIWLASKVEECPRRVRDVINVFHYLRLQRNKLPVTPMVLDQEYVTLKNNVIKAERRILKELGFCVHVKHPHKIIVVYLQVLELEKNRELVQTAWNYMNDSLQTTVFVQYPPETIACACIYLAARVLQIPLPNRPSWFYLFNSTEEDIQKICLTLLCVYQTVKTPYHELEKKVDSCREVLQQEKLKARISHIEEASQFAANSPSSKAASPISGSPSTTEKHSNAQRSSTVPANSESNRVANGTNEKNGRIRRSHGSGYRQSRSRSRSGHRGGKYRRHSSTSSSSSAESSPNGRSKNAHSDLPKSYSQQNSNVKSSEKRHQNRKDKKQRHTSKHHRRREEGNAHKDRDYHSYRRDSSKKHKRKFSPDSPVKLSRVNGDERSPSSPSRKHRHRESHKKKRR